MIDTTDTTVATYTIYADPGNRASGNRSDFLTSHDSTGSYTIGFSVFAAMALIGFAGILSVRPRWRREVGTLAAARI